MNIKLLTIKRSTNMKELISQTTTNISHKWGLVRVERSSPIDSQLKENNRSEETKAKY